MASIIALIIAIVCVGFYIYIWGVSTIGQPYLRLFIFSAIIVYFLFGYRFNVFVYQGFKAPMSDGLYYPVTYIFCGICAGAITAIVYAFNYFRKYRPKKLQKEKEAKENKERWERIRQDEIKREEERKKRIEERDEQRRREGQERYEKIQEREHIKRVNQIKWFEYANILEFKNISHKRDFATALSDIEGEVTNRGNSSVLLRQFDVLVGDSEQGIRNIEIYWLRPSENIIIKPNETAHIKASIKKYIPHQEKYIDIEPIIKTYTYSYSLEEADQYNNFGYKIDLLNELANYYDDKDCIQVL